jgi:hypothetical protein
VEVRQSSEQQRLAGTFEPACKSEDQGINCNATAGLAAACSTSTT